MKLYSVYGQMINMLINEHFACIIYLKIIERVVRLSKKFKQNNNNYAIAYYRFSSHAQNETSIDQQREQAHLYAEKHGLTIIREYADKAISGTTDERPGFQQMLSEVGKLKPAVLILWKTDRLGRDRYILACAKKTIRDAGCSIQYVAEITPTDAPESSLIEGILDSMAEFYSKQLRQNVTRGMRYNAQNALYNGHKMLGYAVDDTKHYIEDKVTAPVVQRIFMQYADGKPLTQIAVELNNQGIKTVLDRNFTVNSLRHILKNRAYIGEYHYGDIVIADGMPRLVSDELFGEVQKRFERNKRKAKTPSTEEDAPRYWLTGKLYCGECGTTMHGMSGTSKTGKPHYYYACKNHRKHKCNLKNIPKDLLEAHVVWVLRDLIEDSENLASLAVDIATYYKNLNSDNGYISGLEAELEETRKGIGSLVKVIEKGVLSDAVTNRLTELENRKTALEEAIETEKLKQALVEDECSIHKYFNMYAHADFDDEDTRNNILEYFVDKIYVYNDRLVITFCYLDDKSQIALDTLTEITGTSGAVECSTLVGSAPLKRQIKLFSVFSFFFHNFVLQSVW